MSKPHETPDPAPTIGRARKTRARLSKKLNEGRNGKFAPIESLVHPVSQPKKYAIVVIASILIYLLSIMIMYFAGILNEAINENITAASVGIGISGIGYLVIQTLYKYALLSFVNVVRPEHALRAAQAVMRHVHHVRRMRSVYAVTAFVYVISALGYFAICFDFAPGFFRLFTKFSSGDDWFLRDHLAAHSVVLAVLGFFVILIITWFSRFMILYVGFLAFAVTKFQLLDSIYLANRAFDNLQRVGFWTSVIVVLGLIICIAVGDIRMDALVLNLVIGILVILALSLIVPIITYGIKLDGIRRNRAKILQDLIRQEDGVGGKEVTFRVAVLDYVMHREAHEKFVRIALRRSFIVAANSAIGIAFLLIGPSLREALGL